MYGKRKLFSIIICLCMIYPTTMIAQEDQTQISRTSISSRVISSEGEPVKGARIYSDDGSVSVLSAADGSFTISVKENSVLHIEKKGFNSVQMTPEQGSIPGEITMEKAEYQLAESDRVNLPYMTLLKRDVPGMVTSLDPEEILKHDANQDFNSALIGRVPGLYGNTDVYGLGEALLVIDGVPRPGQIRFNQIWQPDRVLNLQEISQITVLKDVSSRLLYGARADVPVILVTTREGEPNKRSMKVRLETGIRNPISYPQFLGAADYMELFNEALVNDGKLPKYDQQSIMSTRNGVDPVLYPDEDYYNSTFLRNNKSFYQLTTQASGGNDAATYFAFLGWDRQHSLISLGRKKYSDHISIRGNVNYKITDNIKLKFNSMVMFDVDKGANGDFWQNSASFLPNRSPLLIPLSESDQVPATSILAGNSVLGGTSEFTRNIYGDLVRAGYLNTFSRYLQINTGFDFDLNQFVEGLTASANLAFDLFNLYQARQLNQYAVYQPMLGGMSGDSLYLVQHGVDVKQGEESVINPQFFRKIGLFGTLNYHRVFQEDHEIKAVGIVFRNQFNRNNSYTELRRDLHFGFQANYNFKHKYLVQLGSVLAGSPAFAMEHRWALSPAVAMGWVISEEDFYNSPVFLKLRASIGRIATDRGYHSDYYFRNNYIRGATFTYYDGNSFNDIVNIQSIGNEDLRWSKRDHATIGLNTALLDNTLVIDGGYFYSRYSDVPALQTNTYPAYMGILPYLNYNSYQDQGAELGINYTNSWGDFTFSFGANGTYAIPKVIQMDELNYEYNYLHRTGKPTDAIFGLVADGFYAESDFSNGELNGDLPIPSFGEVQPGDLRYQDLNGDNKIDINDEEVIGYNHARVQYGLHFRFAYKSLELFVLGTGQTGQSTMYNSPYYWVFGERKYPEYITGRWTPATATSATYPRLSSTFNAHNYRSSTFWLHQDNWFTLHTAQLTLNTPFSVAENMFFKQLQVYVRGSNLLTISDNRERRELNIGMEPQFRVFTFGINASF